MFFSLHTGYCGADIKALCTEASLHALRRRYPQIYTSADKLELDVTSIDIRACDFQHAMSCMVPASQRAVHSPGRPLSSIISPLLSRQLSSIIQLVCQCLPHASSSAIREKYMDADSLQVTESKVRRRTKTSESQPFLNASV